MFGALGFRVPTSMWGRIRICQNKDVAGQRDSTNSASRAAGKTCLWRPCHSKRGRSSDHNSDISMSRIRGSTLGRYLLRFSVSGFSRVLTIRVWALRGC